MTLTAVQTQYFQTFGALYPGQVAEAGGHEQVAALRSFVTETVITAGRGVVKGAAIAQAAPVLTPYAVKAPLSGSVDADFVGIAVQYGAMSSDANNNAVTIRATTMAPIAERGSAVIIGAKVNGATAAVDGGTVYMSVSHASIPVGEFAAAADTGLIALTGAKWYGAAAAGTVGRIKL